VRICSSDGSPAAVVRAPEDLVARLFGAAAVFLRAGFLVVDLCLGAAWPMFGSVSLGAVSGGMIFLGTA